MKAQVIPIARSKTLAGAAMRVVAVRKWRGGAVQVVITPLPSARAGGRGLPRAAPNEKERRVVWALPHRPFNARVMAENAPPARCQKGPTARCNDGRAPQKKRTKIGCGRERTTTAAACQSISIAITLSSTAIAQ
jgi:hypothetical protein